MSGKMIAIAAMLAISLGAGPGDDVARVRVPASKVASWFPANADLKRMPADDFETLLKAVRDRPEAPRRSRMIRARHFARWDDGVLLGRSELTFASPVGLRPDLVVLDSWSPAVLTAREVASPLRTTLDGRLGVLVDPAGPSSLTIDWCLRGRAGSDGRAFALALPDVEISALTLDLPANLVPDRGAGNWVGPEPGTSADRATWRVEGARGALDLRFRDRVPSDASAMVYSWLEGPTRIDLNASPSNWRAKWILDELPGSSGRLLVELDPGLDLVDVSGPRVGSFRVETVGKSSRLSIVLVGQAIGPSPITIDAICHAPTDGTWAIPSARPLGATWTGGRTSVRLDPSRVLQTCVERSGRRVTPRAGDPLDSSALIFEPNGGVGSVADLTFRKPAADATIEVRGHLRLDEGTPRVDVALAWTVERGRLLSHAVDIPAGWTANRVTTVSGQAVAWHAEPLSKGGTRVHMNPSLPDEEARSLHLILSASAREAGGLGSFDLPRVRPAAGGPRVVDEVWVATVEPGLALLPIVAQGLAWLDPFSPPGPRAWTSAELRGSLAWRWISDDAEAKVDRTRLREPSRGDVRLDALISRGRIKLDWRVAIESNDSTLRTIPIHCDALMDSAIRWQIAGGGPVLQARPLSDAMRLRHQFPMTGAAWELELASSLRGTIEILGHDDRPWDGAGRVPVLSLPASYQMKGLINLAIPETSQVKVRSTALTPIVLAETARDRSQSTDDFPRETDPRSRNAGTFRYREVGGRLDVETTPGHAGPTGGVVREASLTTQAFPGSGLRHRLNLRITTDEARAIELTMPAGVTLDRIRRDGQAVAVAALDGSIRVAIPAPTAGRPSCGLTLEYRTLQDLRSGRFDLSSLVPTFSLPCLSFVWELTTPESWDVQRVSAGLTVTDPRPVPDWWARLLGFRSPSWPRISVGQDQRTTDRELMLRSLDATFADFASDEITLGDWLLKVDAGRWPIVVDRLALQASGWGPMTRLGPLGPEAKAVDSVARILPTIGLTALPFDGLILITTRSDVPEGGSNAPAWYAALLRAATTGADATDRFQSAGRYRGEPTPRSLSVGDSSDRISTLNGWQRHRLVTTGWPGSGMSVALLNRSAETSQGWAVALITLAVGYLTRKIRRSYRSIGLLAVWFTGLVGVAIAYPEPDAIASGLIRGGLAVLALWLGRSLRKPTTDSFPDSNATTVTRASRLIPATLVVLIVGFLAIPSLASLRADATLLVVFPFEGVPDPNAKLDHAVLLLDDFEELSRLARPATPAPPVGPTLKALVHHVALEGNDLAVVESRFDIDAGEGEDENRSWVIPVGSARDLTATVDDQATPIRFTEDGGSAIVAIPGPGDHTLRFRRTIPVQREAGGGRRIKVPVNRSTLARVVVARDDQRPAIEVLNAVGRARLFGEGVVEAELGPLGLLEIRWRIEGQGDRGEGLGPVEATILWDARPAGDLVRCRLVHTNPDGLGRLRVATEPGVQIRGLTMEGVVGLSQAGTVDRPEWVVHLDPPLRRGEPFQVDFWRPAVVGSTERRIPRVDFPGMTRVKTIVGFRRQSDWIGRLEPRPPAEALADLNFERIWGPMPDDGLVVAGAVKSLGPTDLRLTTGPSALRRSSRTSFVGELKPGRLDATIESVLNDRQGRSFELEIGLPTDFRIIKLEMPGLVDWQKVARDRIRLQLDGSEERQRSIKIQGYLPVSPDSVLSESREFLARIPWPRLLKVDNEPGSLTLISPSKAPIEVLDGVTLLSTALTDDPLALHRLVYQVHRVEGLGPVRWSSPMAKVAISVLSDLTIDTNAATWTAQIGCEIAGGPAKSLHWKLPTDWARQATLEFEGAPHPLVKEIKGETTTCTLNPNAPIWGQARLILRSTRPLPLGNPWAYPEVAPLASPGRGEVERYDLTIANVSGRALEVNGSPELQAIDTTPFQAGKSTSPTDTIDRAFHVTGAKWSLQLRVASSETARRTRVAHVQLNSVIGEDGRLWGRARFDLDPGSGPFLALRLPENADLPWATVDGQLAPPLRENASSWLVPLGDRSPRRVVVAWRNSALVPGSAASGVLTLPLVADQPDVSTIIAASAPETFELSGGPARIEATTWEMENAERTANRIVRAIAGFDRGSPRDRDFLEDGLVEFELLARSLGRSRASRVDLDRVIVARASIDDAARGADLEDLILEARSRVGLPAAFVDTTSIVATELTEPLRVRRIGTPWFFRNERAGHHPLSSLQWTIKPGARPWLRPEPWSIVLIGSFVSTALAGLIALAPLSISGRKPWVVTLLVALALLFGLEPLGVLALVAMAGLGRFSD